MACVYVWRIAHKTGPEANEVKKILMRLSGRQMKWKHEYTYNALYAGLSSLLAMQDLLERYPVDEIRGFISSIYRGKKICRY